MNRFPFHWHMRHFHDKNQITLLPFNFMSIALRRKLSHEKLDMDSTFKYQNVGNFHHKYVISLWKSNSFDCTAQIETTECSWVGNFMQSICFQIIYFTLIWKLHTALQWYHWSLKSVTQETEWVCFQSIFRHIRFNQIFGCHSQLGLPIAKVRFYGIINFKANDLLACVATSTPTTSLKQI